MPSFLFGIRLQRNMLMMEMERARAEEAAARLQAEKTADPLRQREQKPDEKPPQASRER